MDKTIASRREVLSFKPRTKRYNLSLPGHVFDEVEKTAKKHKVSTADTIRRFIGLGIVADKVTEDGGAVLIRDKKGEIREVELF